MLFRSVEWDALAGFRETLWSSKLLEALFDFGLNEIRWELRQKLLLNLLLDFIFARLSTST